jgi:CheY-like chemotaxis protein
MRALTERGGALQPRSSPTGIDVAHMKTIRLILWNAEEAQARALILSAAGYNVDAKLPSGIKSVRLLQENPPDAVVIDLSRLPSQGRDIGLLLRQYKNTRNTPLVFVEGDQMKVERIMRLLPDAVYGRWANILSSLKAGIDHPPLEPVRARSVFDAYAGTSLPKKIGIKPRSLVVLACAPRGFKKKLEPLPEHVRVTNRPATGRDVTIWFVRSHKELARMLRPMITMIGEGKLWIAWPKKSGPLSTDLSQPAVRSAGLSHGLVDYKICSVDDTWSALLFTKRK